MTTPEMPCARPLRLDTTEPDFATRFAERLHWSAETDAEIEARVAQILADVRARGDAAVLECTRRFDGVEAASVAELEIGPQALQAAFDAGLSVAGPAAPSPAGARAVSLSGSRRASGAPRRKP